MGFAYNFPADAAHAARWDETGMLGMCKDLAGEVAELASCADYVEDPATYRADWARVAARQSCEAAASEALDCLHVCETILRRLESYGVDLAEARDRVEAKNRRRGYYDATESEAADGC